MSNQTIDGVPRDYVLRLTPEAHSVLLGMVEHCLNIRACMGMDEGFKDFDTEEEHDFVKELRALLDADKVNNRQMGLMQFVEAHPIKPAAQPQGEPVAWIVTDMNGDSYFAYDRQTPNDKPLYAEQPAPVAVAIHTRHTEPSAPEPQGDERTGYVQTDQNVTPLYVKTLIFPEQSSREKPKHLNRHGKVPPAGNDRITMRHVHLVGAGDSPVPITHTQNGVIVNLDGYTCYAPGAEPKVVIPERLVMTDGLHTYEYVTGHNAAIDKMLGIK